MKQPIREIIPAEKPAISVYRGKLPLPEIWGTSLPTGRFPGPNLPAVRISINSGHEMSI